MKTVKIPYPEPIRDDTLMSKELMTGTFFDANFKGSKAPFEKYEFPFDVDKATNMGIYNLSDGEVWEEDWARLKEISYLPLYAPLGEDTPPRLAFTPPLSKVHQERQIFLRDIEGLPYKLFENERFGEWAYFYNDVQKREGIVLLKKVTDEALSDAYTDMSDYDFMVKHYLDDYVALPSLAENLVVSKWDKLALFFIDVEKEPKLLEKRLCTGLMNFKQDEEESDDGNGNGEYKDIYQDSRILRISDYEDKLFVMVEEIKQTDTYIMEDWVGEYLGEAIEFKNIAIYELKDKEFKKVYEAKYEVEDEYDTEFLPQNITELSCTYRYMFFHTNKVVFIYDKKENKAYTHEYKGELERFIFNPVQHVVYLKFEDKEEFFRFTPKGFKKLKELSEKQKKIFSTPWYGNLEYDYLQNDLKNNKAYPSHYPMRRGYGEFDIKYLYSGTSPKARRRMLPINNTDDGDMAFNVSKNRKHFGLTELGNGRRARMYKKYKAVVYGESETHGDEYLIKLKYK